MPELTHHKGPQRAHMRVAAAESVVRQRASVDPTQGSKRATEELRAGLPGTSTCLCPDSREVLDEGLDEAISMLHADRGNIQIVDPASGSLRIAVHVGFGDEFLEYFAVVDDDASACGRATRRLAQIVISDVNTDAGFTPHREIAAASGFRAIQSTPLMGKRGRLVGVLSTHFQRPHRPSDRDLQLMTRYGELIGEAVEECQEEAYRQAPAQL